MKKKDLHSIDLIITGLSKFITKRVNKEEVNDSTTLFKEKKTMKEQKKKQENEYKQQD